MGISENRLREDAWDCANEELKKVISEIPTTGEQREKIFDCVNQMWQLFNSLNDPS